MAKEMPYAQSGRNDYKWTSLAYDLATSGRLTVGTAGRGKNTAVHAGGECPRCGHDVHYTHLEKIVLPGDAATLGVDETEPDEAGTTTTSPQAGYITLDVACWCEQEHPGRPKNVPHGCGIVFAVEVLVTRE